MSRPVLNKGLTSQAKGEFPGPQSGTFSRWMDAVLRSFQTLAAQVAGIADGLTTDNFTATAGQTVFPLSEVPPSPGAVLMFVNGQRQIPGFDFTVAGAVLTWLPVSFALGAGDNVLISY